MQREKLSLYEYGGCPYCARVRRFLSELGETVELRDTMMERDNLLDLVAATGRQTVPCLRIERPDESVEWLHESKDIIDFLRDYFAPAEPQT